MFKVNDKYTRMTMFFLFYCIGVFSNIQQTGYTYTPKTLLQTLHLSCSEKVLASTHGKNPQQWAKVGHWALK